MKKSIIEIISLVVDKKGVNETALTEIESLKSIYPDECQIQNKEKGMDVIRMFVPAVFGRDSAASVDLLIKIPLQYPHEAFLLMVFLTL